MDEALKKQLTDIFGKLAVEAGEQLAPAYGAGVARMALKEVLALDAFINAKKFAEAQALIRSKMTEQELADEKSKLAELTFEAAESNAQGWDFARAVLTAGLKVLLALALGLVGL